MNVKDAAARILAEAGEPLHPREITRRILKAGIWSGTGKTPEATVSANIYSDIKEKGEDSPFIKVGPGTFALRNAHKNGTKSAPTSPSVNSGLSFTACAEKALKEFGKKKPMHYRDITTKALEKGWLVTSGKTPEATMYSQVINEIQRQKKRGERPRFVQHGKGYLGLSQWMGQGLAFQIEQHNQQIRKNLLKHLKTLTAKDFEILISKLLTGMGFEKVEVTRISNDGGIDVRGTLVVGDVVNIKMAVQVKKWKNNIQSKIVREVRGSLGIHEQGLIITTSNFSSGAIQEATLKNKIPIALMNGEQLVKLLMEFGIGVKRSTPDFFELNEESLFEEIET